jgi:hypothetical protein
MMTRWTRLCSVLGPRKMVRPENNLHTYAQLTADGLVPYLARPFAEDCVPWKPTQEGPLNT